MLPSIFLRLQYLANEWNNATIASLIVFERFFKRRIVIGTDEQQPKTYNESIEHFKYCETSKGAHNIMGLKSYIP